MYFEFIGARDRAQARARGVQEEIARALGVELPEDGEESEEEREERINEKLRREREEGSR